MTRVPPLLDIELEAVERLAALWQTAAPHEPLHGVGMTLEAMAVEVRRLRSDRKRIAAWMRVTPRACGVLISIASGQDIARLADAIERGDHEEPAR